MADEIVYVTITESLVDVVEVESYIPEPLQVNVQITGAEGFTFVTDTEPETEYVGHTWFKPSTGEAFVWHSGQWRSFPELAVPTGTIIQGGWTTAPAGCAFLNGQTLVDGALTYPLLAAYYPSWVSGDDIVLPDVAGMTLIATNGTPGTTPITSNSKTVTITANNLPTHTHPAGSLGTGVESQGHVHYLNSTAGGWAATATMGNPSADHTHDSGHGTNWGSQSPLGSGNSWAFPGGSSNRTTGTVSAWHTHALSGYTTGAHQQHTHAVTGSTGNNSTSATALPYNTTPAHMLVKYAVKL